MKDPSISNADFWLAENFVKFLKMSGTCKL